MSGTFPLTDIFQSVKITSDLKVLKNIDRNNHYFEKFQKQYWQFDINTVPLTRSQWSQIYTFLIKQNGPGENFQISIPTFTETTGTYNGVNGDISIYSVVPGTVGDNDVWFSVQSGTSGTLKSGDLIQFSNHTKIYQIREDVTLASAGTHNVKIFPSLLTAVTSANTVNFQDLEFTVSLINDTVEFNSDENGYYTIKFAVEEYY